MENLWLRFKRKKKSRKEEDKNEKDNKRKKDKKKWDWLRYVSFNKENELKNGKKVLILIYQNSFILNSLQASVWGSASSNLSWASKAATVGTPPSNNPNPALSTPQNKPKQAHPGSSSLVTSSPAPWSSAVNSNSNASGGGFWDDAAPPPGLNNSNSSTPAQSNKNKKKTNNKEAQKNNMKTAKEDAKVAQIFRENSAKNTPRQNEFEAWCSSALSNLNAQVDIPTFMAFLKDIESPYEVTFIHFSNSFKSRICIWAHKFVLFVN